MPALSRAGTIPYTLRILKALLSANNGSEAMAIHDMEHKFQQTIPALSRAGVIGMPVTGFAINGITCR
jgi:hypothetical protein